MTKQQLLEKVAAKIQLSKGQVEVALASVLEQIAEALQANERVDLRWFGGFMVKDKRSARASRRSRNAPRDWDAIHGGAFSLWRWRQTQPR